MILENYKRKVLDSDNLIVCEVSCEENGLNDDYLDIRKGGYIQPPPALITHLQPPPPLSLKIHSNTTPN